MLAAILSSALAVTAPFDHSAFDSLLRAHVTDGLVVSNSDAALDGIAVFESSHPVLTEKSIQRRLEDFGAWFNERRPHSALHGRTPREAWEGRVLPEPVSIRARDQLQPQIDICRGHYHGDPRLPVIEISVRLAA